MNQHSRERTARDMIAFGIFFTGLIMVMLNIGADWQLIAIYAFMAFCGFFSAYRLRRLNR
jgi:sugar phosphate permease